MSEREMLEALAQELGVSPQDKREVALGLTGLDGRVYSVVELLYAHVRLLKSAELVASDRSEVGEKPDNK